jgi:DNA invertase Pin-like site-specific DNA recombinase
MSVAGCRCPSARGLLAAIEMIEAGRAEQLVVAYFDRLVRSFKVQLKVIERVERAGGEIFALDHGKLTNGTAAQRLSTNMLGSVFQYFAEITGEKVTAAQARAVARGVYPHPRIPVGYVRGEDGVLVVEPAGREGRGACVQAPRSRRVAGGDSGVAGRERDRACALRRSRMYLGEIHFGGLHITRAHEAIVEDRRLFERVQRRTVSRGRQARSERLLARLGVLRCETCGSRMVINTDSGSYRCGDTSSNRCQRRALPVIQAVTASWFGPSSTKSALYASLGVAFVLLGRRYVKARPGGQRDLFWRLPTEVEPSLLAPADLLPNREIYRR